MQLLHECTIVTNKSVSYNRSISSHEFATAFISSVFLVDFFYLLLIQDYIHNCTWVLQSLKGTGKGRIRTRGDTKRQPSSGVRGTRVKATTSTHLRFPFSFNCKNIVFFHLLEQTFSLFSKTHFPFAKMKVLLLSYRCGVFCCILDQ